VNISENNYPKHWELNRIRDIFEIIKEKGSECTVPYLEIGDVDIHKKKYLLKNKVSVKGCKVSKKGDILISRVRPTRGAIVEINEKTILVSSAFTVLRNKGKFVQSFPFYFLAYNNKFLKYLGDNCTGSLYPTVSENLLSDYIIPLPPLHEQQAIVSEIEKLLSELENGKQQLQIAQQQLKVYRQSLLKWAFEGKLTNKKVKEGELPERWKWVKLGEVCHNVEYGSATKSKKVGKVPVLRMGNIQNGKFEWEDLVYTDDKEEIEKYILKKGDVLFNRTNSAEWVGKTAQYKGERPAIFAGYLIRINRIETIIDSTFLTYYLNTHAAKQFGNSVKSFGVNQSNINGTKLKTYPMPLPPLKEQHQIVNELESKLTVCDNIEGTISKSLQQVETLRQSILKKAFEGELI